MEKCPFCEENELHSEKVLNCLSRIDNETYICNDCGLKEALEGIKRGGFLNED